MLHTDKRQGCECEMIKELGATWCVCVSACVCECVCGRASLGVALFFNNTAPTHTGIVLRQSNYKVLAATLDFIRAAGADVWLGGNRGGEITEAEQS